MFQVVLQLFYLSYQNSISNIEVFSVDKFVENLALAMTKPNVSIDKGIDATVNFRQDDKEWGNIVIGHNKEGKAIKVSSAGCLLTSFAILIKAYGLDSNITPEILVNELLKKSGKDNSTGFTSGGGLKFGHFCDVVDGVDSIKPIEFNSKKSKFDQIKEQFDLGNMVAVQVGNKSGKTHYVSVLGIDGDNIIVSDPGSGEIYNLWQDDDHDPNNATGMYVLEPVKSK